jgi:hypothetical protein
VTGYDRIMAASVVAVDYVINEVLCVLSNNFGKHPRATIANVLTEFYSNDEICDAKKVLMELADTLISPKADELKRITSRVGDGKHRRDTDDVLSVFTALDSRKIGMPRFFAADSSRIPSFREIDLYKITSSLEDLAMKVDGLNNKVDQQAAALTKMALDAPKMPPTSAVCSSAPASSADPAQPDDVADTSPWRTVLAGGRSVLSSDVSLPSTSNQPAIKQPPRRKVVGTRTPVGSNPGKLTASSSRSEKSWILFIGRLGKETEDSDLKEHLEENGISVIEIRKLAASKEWQQKSSAFRVSIGFDSKDAVMCADLWPDNVVVRDWFMKPK